MTTIKDTQGDPHIHTQSQPSPTDGIDLADGQSVANGDQRDEFTTEQNPSKELAGIGSGGGPNIDAHATGPWELWEIRRELSELIKSASSSNFRNLDMQKILVEAIGRLQNNFDPQEKSAGSIPSERDIATALSRAFNYLYRHMPEASRSIEKSDIQRAQAGSSRDGFLFKLLKDFVSSNAAQLSLLGAKTQSGAWSKRSGPVMSFDATVKRVVTAQAIPLEIQAMARDLPDSEPMTELLTKAEAAGKGLSLFGTDESEIAAALSKNQERLRALKIIDELELARRNAIAVHTRETVNFDDPRIEELYKKVADDLEEWFNNNKITMEERPFLETALREYIAIRFSEQSDGKTMHHFDLSESAFEKTMALIEHSKGIENINAMYGLMARALSSLARSDSSREIEVEMEMTSAQRMGVTSTKSAAPRQRLVSPIFSFQKILGDDLYAKLDKFYSDVLSGSVPFVIDEDPAVEASHFYKFMFHYVSRCANEYGAENTAKKLKERGLETRITKAIFLEVKDSYELFTNSTLELVRLFFKEAIPEKTAAATMSLKPTAREYETSVRKMSSSSRGGDGFINWKYDFKMRKAMPLKTFLGQISGVGEPGFEEEFNSYNLGITWKSMMNWGEVRANADGKTEEIGEKHWERMIENWKHIAEHFVRQESNPEGMPGSLLEFMKEYTPKDRSQESWLEDLDKKRNFAELKALAIANKPKGISELHWMMYAGWMASINRIEDLTVQPENYDAMIAAYYYLNALAAKYGEKIDFMEYLGCIFPVIARILLRADEELIKMHDSGLFHNIPYGAWSYRLLAQQIRNAGLESHTKVRGSTFEAHLSKEYRPELWNIRNYATGEMAEQLSMNREELIEFFSGFLMFAPEINARVAVFDAEGAQISHRAQGVESKYKFHLVESDWKHVTQGTSPSSSAERYVDDKIKSGHYTARTSEMRTFLSTAALLMPQGKLLRADGSELALDDAKKEFEKFAKEELLRSLIFAEISSSASKYAPDDIRDARKFYAESFENYSSAFTDGTSILGDIVVENFSVPFEITYGNVGRTDAGRVQLSIGALAELASKEKWSSQHTRNVAEIAKTVEYLVAIGEMTREEASDWDSLEKAVMEKISIATGEQTGALSDYMRLAKSEEPTDAAASKPKNTIRETKKMPYAVGVLKWQKLFAEHVASLADISRDEAALVSDALIKYLHVAGSAKKRFWPKTLEKIMAASGIADEVVALEDIKSFLKSMGFETEHSIHSAAASSGDLPEVIADRIADEIFEDYKALFPLRKNSAGRERIPLNLDLIAEISGLHLGERGLPNANSDVKKFEALIIPRINKYNESASGSLRHEEHLPSEGMLNQKFTSAAKDRGMDGSENIAAVRRSLFSMAGSIRRAKLPADMEIEEALQKTGLIASSVSENTSLLKSTMQGQIASLNLINEAIDHPKYGVAKFLTDNYEATGINPSDLKKLIGRYAKLRLSGNLPAQIRLLAFESLDPSSPALASLLADLYERIAAEWFYSARLGFSDIMEMADLSLEDISNGTAPPPADIEDMKIRVVTLAKIAESFEEILEAEKILLAMEDFLGIDTTRMPIIRKVESSFSGDISAVHASLDAELNDAVLRISGFYSESLRLYTEAAELASEPAVMEEEAAKNQLERAISSSAILTKQITELDALTPLASRIYEIISLRNFDAAIASALKKIPAEIQIDEDSMPANSHELARLYIGRAADLLRSAETKTLEKWVAAEHTLAEIRAEARRVEVAKTASRLDSFSAALENKTGELIPILTEGVRAKLEKLDGIKSGLISDEAPSEEFLRDALLSSDALYEGATHGIDKSGALAAEISDILEQRNLLGHTAGLSESIAAAEGTLLTHGPSDLLEEALRRCKEAFEKAEAALSLFVEVKKDITTGIDSIKAALENYEDRLPIAPPFKPKTAEDMEIFDATEIADFSSKPISSRAHRSAKATLAAITNAKIISFKEGSMIITSQEAEKFTSWKKHGRRTPLTLRLVTGEVKEIEQGRFGIRLADIRDIDPENPHVKTIRAAKLLANIRSSGTAFAADIISSGQNMPISSLLSDLAQYDPSTGKEGALATVSSWAMRNLHIIPREIYINYISINKKNAPEPLSYTEERHAAWRKLNELAHENPDMGPLIFYQIGPNGEEIEIWRRPVKIAEVAESLKENSGRIRSYDIQTAGWVEQSLSNILGNAKILRFSIGGSYRSSPIKALNLKTSYSITADPELMKLARLMLLTKEDEVLRRASKMTSVDFPSFMNCLLSPISMAAHDVTPPLTTREAQAIALEAYNIIRGSAKKIDPSEVRPESLAGWLQTTPFYDGTEQSLTSLKKKDALATRISNLMYMLSIYSGNPPKAIEFDSMISDAEFGNFLERKFAEEAQSIYLNMHLPVLVSPDKDLFKSNPETLGVGSAQLWSMLSIFEPAMKVSLPESNSLSAVRKILSGAPAWIRILIQRFPSLSRPLCLIALVYDQMPESFRDGLSKVMREVMTVPNSPNDEERAKQRIISFYREHAAPGAHGHQGIIQALNRKIPGGHTLASWCSGSHDLAEGFKDRWEDFEPENVIRIAFFELTKLRPALAARLIEKMDAEKDKDQLYAPILSFIEKYPEMRNPVLSLSVLYHNMETESKNETRDFLMNLESSNPEELVKFLQKFSIQKAIIDALKADSGVERNMSTAVYLTGEEKPYIPTEILPPAIRLRAIIPGLAKMNPDQGHFIKIFPKDKNSKVLLNLIKTAEKYPEMGSAVVLMILAQFRMDDEARINFHRYFENMHNPGPKELVDAILDLRLVTHLEEIVSSFDTTDDRGMPHANAKPAKPRPSKKEKDDPRGGGGSSGGTPAGGSGRTSPPQTPHPTASAYGKWAAQRATPPLSQSSEIDAGAAALLTYRSQQSQNPARMLSSGMPNAGVFGIQQITTPFIHTPATSIVSMQAFTGIRPMIFR